MVAYQATLSETDWFLCKDRKSVPATGDRCQALVDPTGSDQRCGMPATVSFLISDVLYNYCASCFEARNRGNALVFFYRPVFICGAPRL